MEKRSSLLEQANKSFVLQVRDRCGSLSITKPVLLLTNEPDVRSVLHG